MRFVGRKLEEAERSVDAKAQRPSLADVARLAGVSTATVSRVLNTPARVRAATRAQVDAAVSALGYTPHFGGRALASNRTDTVGAVIPTMDNAIFARGLQAMQEALAAQGATLLVATSNYDADEEAAQIKTLLARGVDGVALIGEARASSVYRLLERQAVPFVLMWSWRADCPYTCVGFDNRAAAADVAARVLALGHREIAMIAGPTAGNDRAHDRVVGVQSALASLGAPLATDRLLETPYRLQAGRAAAARFLSRTPRPTALICGNDVLAAGALIEARARRLRVPEDVSITGFDDIDLAVALDPPLSTVHVPHRRMGSLAAEKLLALRDPGGDASSIRISADFVQRASLGPSPPG